MPHLIHTPFRYKIEKADYVGFFSWWARRESNPRPPACKAGALDQLSYSPVSRVTKVILFLIFTK